MHPRNNFGVGVAGGGRRLLRSEPGRRVPPPPTRHAGAALVRVPRGGPWEEGQVCLRVSGEISEGVTRVGAEKDNKPTFTRFLEPGSPT